jgi:hypothetical protein
MYFFTCFLHLKDVVPAKTEEANKKNLSSATWVPFKNRFHYILQTLISQNMNGSETYLPLTTSPD